MSEAFQLEAFFVNLEAIIPTNSKIKSDTFIFHHSQLLT